MPFRPSTLRPAIAAVALALMVALAFVVTGHNWVTRADIDLVRGIATSRSALVTHAAETLTYLGNLIVLALVTLAAGLVLWRTRRRSPGWAFLPAMALVAAAIVDPLAKLAVGRPRPPAELAAMLETATGYPSGHSAQSAATWIVLALVVASPLAWRRAVVAGALVAAVVGITRVVLGVHSPTDVLGGWLLGATCALLAIEAATRLSPRTTKAPQLRGRT